MCISTAQACGTARILVRGGPFRGRRRETSCFGASKSAFRDSCKGSELLLFYFQMEFSWQVQRFGHVGDRRGAQIS